MSTARVEPGRPRERWQVRVPGSKSLTNRALLLAGVAPGRTVLRHPLRADDTEVMAEALRALGAGVEIAEEAWTVDGLGGPPRGTGQHVYCGMAGTVGRFIVAMLAAGEGTFEVDAHPQLRSRPLGPLVDALAQQGARLSAPSLPLTLEASGLSGGMVPVDTSVSSQFLSGLVMAAPFAETDTQLTFGPLVSKPYLELTIQTMRAFGTNPVFIEDAVTIAATGGYTSPGDHVIEPDASTASYFLANAALTATTVTIPGLDRSVTAQGDIELVDFLARMGCEVATEGTLTLTGPRGPLRGVEVDMGDSSDVFMTLACVAPFAQGPTTIENIAHARAKESDRIAATADNLKRCGIRVDEGPDFLRVHPGTPVTPAEPLPTYDDHRIAMAFSLLGTKVPVLLDEPEVVAKTCPTFFELWRQSGATVAITP